MTPARINETFEALKSELIDRARLFNDSKGEIILNGLEAATNIDELTDIFKGQFALACRRRILTTDIIDRYRWEFSDREIYANPDEDGFDGGDCYILCDCGCLEVCNSFKCFERDATIVAMGDAAVVAWGNAEVYAYGHAEVRAHDAVKVWAWGNVTIETYDRARVYVNGGCRIVLGGNAWAIANSMSCVEFEADKIRSINQ